LSIVRSTREKAGRKEGPGRIMREEKKQGGKGKRREKEAE